MRHISIHQGPKGRDSTSNQIKNSVLGLRLSIVLAPDDGCGSKGKAHRVSPRVETAVGLRILILDDVDVKQELQ